MQTLTAPQGYRPGGVYGICDRCAFKRRLGELRTEWTGFKVCRECYDPRPADLDPPRLYPEGLPVRGARPEQTIPVPDVPVPLFGGNLELGDPEDSGLLYWWGMT